MTNGRGQRSLRSGGEALEFSQFLVPDRHLQAVQGTYVKGFPQKASLAGADPGHAHHFQEAHGNFFRQGVQGRHATRVNHGLNLGRDALADALDVPQVAVVRGIGHADFQVLHLIGCPFQGIDPKGVGSLQSHQIRGIAEGFGHIAVGNRGVRHA